MLTTLKIEDAAGITTDIRISEGGFSLTDAKGRVLAVVIPSQSAGSYCFMACVVGSEMSMDYIPLRMALERLMNFRPG